METSSRNPARGQDGAQRPPVESALRGSEVVDGDPTAGRGGNLLMVSGDRWVVAGERGPFYYMLEEFSKHWDRIDVIGRRPQRRVHEVVFGNVHLHHARGGRLGTPLFVRSTGLRLAAERPYVAITSHDYAPFLNALGSRWITRRTGIPVLSELHHVAGVPRAANLRERFDRWASRHYANWCLGWAAGIRVVNSVEMPELLESWGVPAQRVHVLPSLYLDTHLFRPGEPREPEADAIFCARLVSNKGVLDLVEAARRLVVEGRTGLRVRIVGRGPLAGRLERTIRRARLSEHVEHIPWVETAEDLAELYRTSRLFVCASLSEGGPRAASEAMACGTPVLGTRVGLLREAIDSGRNGHLYDGSIDGLAAGLRTMLDDPEGLASMRRELIEHPPLARYERGRVLAEFAQGIRRVAREA